VANTNGDGAARSPRHSAIIVRRIFLLLLVYGAVAGAQRPAAAFSPYDLFLRTDATSLAAGGGDVPGQITGHPEVRRPTSLAQSDQGLLRLECCSQTPLRLERDSATIGRWHTTNRSQQWVLPLGKRRDDCGWTLGLQRETITTDIWYHLENQDYQVYASENPLTAALAYEGESGWIVGVAHTRGEITATAQGARLRDILDLPDDTTQGPRLHSIMRQSTLGLARDRGDWEWGIQYYWSKPKHTLYVSRAGSQYTAPIQAAGRRREAYAALHRGNETYFLTGWDSDSESTGTILLGLTARGDTEVTSQDSSVGVGWRRKQDVHIDQVELDWRRSCFQTYDQGYAGILPGLSANVYGLRANGQVSTMSLRYGRQRRLSDSWSWLSGISAHYAEVDGNWRVRSSQGIGRDPETLSECCVSGGLVRMLAVSVGIAYQTGRWNGTLAYAGGYATVNDAFRTVLEKEPSKEGPSNKLKPKPLLALSVEYCF